MRRKPGCLVPLEAAVCMTSRPPASQRRPSFTVTRSPNAWAISPDRAPVTGLRHACIERSGGSRKWACCRAGGKDPQIPAAKIGPVVVCYTLTAAGVAAARRPRKPQLNGAEACAAPTGPAMTSLRFATALVRVWDARVHLAHLSGAISYQLSAGRQAAASCFGRWTAGREKPRSDRHILLQSHQQEKQRHPRARGERRLPVAGKTP